MARRNYLQPDPDLDVGVADSELADVLVNVVFLRDVRRCHDSGGGRKAYHVLQEHTAWRRVRRPIARNDALDAGVLCRSEYRALRLKEVGSNRRDQDISALEERYQLVMRGFRQVRVHEHFRAALLEVDHGGLARRAHNHGNTLLTSMFR